MATTFAEFAKRADFSGGGAPTRPPERAAEEQPPEEGGGVPPIDGQDGRNADLRQVSPVPLAGGAGLGGLVYSIQIHLPESRDQAVYDALFRSLKTHLLQ